MNPASLFSFNTRSKKGPYTDMKQSVYIYEKNTKGIFLSRNTGFFFPFVSFAIPQKVGDLFWDGWHNSALEVYLLPV